MNPLLSSMQYLPLTLFDWLKHCYQSTASSSRFKVTDRKKSIMRKNTMLAWEVYTANGDTHYSVVKTYCLLRGQTNTNAHLYIYYWHTYLTAWTLSAKINIILQLLVRKQNRVQCHHSSMIIFINWRKIIMFHMNLYRNLLYMLMFNVNYRRVSWTIW